MYLNGLVALMQISAGYSFDACLQLGKLKRLGEVIIGSQLKTIYFIIERIFRRYDNCSRLGFHRFQFPEQIEAVALWDHYINKNHIVTVRHNFVEPFSVIFSRFTDMPFTLQVGGDILE